MPGFRLTPLERAWTLYDVGNSAFTLMLATILPIFFDSIAGRDLTSVEYLAYWGYAASLATLACALLAPVLGSVADRRGMKVRVFSVCLGAGVLGCALLGFIDAWLAFLVVLVVTRLAYSLSLVMYDAMIVDVTDAGRVDYVSAMGYALGYIGSCIPFAVCLVMVLTPETFGMTASSAMAAAMVVTAAWWLAFSVPMVRRYRQTHFVDGTGSALDAFRRLAGTLRSVRMERKAFLFLVAFFFFIDGVYTIIEMATAYGQAIGLDTSMLLVALLVTQVVAFPCTIMFGRLSRGRDTLMLLALCILAYLGITVFAAFMNDIAEFFVLAVMVGVFQGGIQAMSRSYFSRIIPPERSGEFFGLMDIFGKGASFMGTLMVSAVSQATGSMSLGILTIAALFVIGLLLLMKVAGTPDPVRGETG